MSAEVSATAATLPADLGPDDVVLLGWPVAHSRSPAMHTAAATHLGLPLRYRTLAVAPEELEAVVTAFGAAGIRGANVTVPHKRAVMPRCDVLTDEARLVGAVNTLTWERTDDGLVLEGHNTDAIGLAAALAEDVGPLAEVPVLLVGTGGAARAAAVALARSGARISVAGRDPRASAAVLDVVRDVDHLGACAVGTVDLLHDAALRSAVEGATLVVNATSVGLREDHLPEALEALEAPQTAYDLVYGVDTPFLAAAWDAGAAAHDGIGMLVHQAAASFARWTGAVAPVAVMRDAARR